MHFFKSILNRFLFSHLHLKSLWLNIIISFYFTSVLNLGLWRYILVRMDFGWGFNAYLLCFLLPIFLFLLFFLIFSLIILPYFGKAFLVPLILVASAANYAMFNLGITIDPAMIQNIMETNTREALELMTFQAILWFFITGVIPAILLVAIRIDYLPYKREIIQRLKLFCAGLVLITLIGFSGFKQYYFFRHDNRAISSLTNPFNIFRSTLRNIRRHSIHQREFTYLDPAAKRTSHVNDNPSVFILIVGETARADRFSLNGYNKETNAELSKEDVISFKKVYSCGTSTSISVPCMFSVKPRREFNTHKAPYSENFLDLLKQTGYNVIWLDNDEGCKGVCKRVETEQLDQSKNRKYCSNGTCFDEILIDGLEQRLAQIKQDTFIVMHTIGSHGPAYYLRYPDNQRKFKPTCDSNDVQNCDPEGLNNAYDNTIHYTNVVVAKTINILKKFPQLNPGLIYLSDHGESLGENGVFLHAYNYSIAPDAQKHVPFILWMSEGMRKQKHYSYSCLAKQAETGEFSHDNLYHTVLAMMDIESKTYNPELDMFSKCRSNNG